MSEQQAPEDFEFDEIIEEDLTLLESVSHITEIPICLQKLVVFPFEEMTLRISDPVVQQMIADIEDEEEAEMMLGIVAPAADGHLPPVGTIGVAADIEEVITTGYGNLQLVRVQGFIRYRIEEYVETDKLYPVARVSYFEDDPDTPAEKLLRSKLVAELREIMKQITPQDKLRKVVLNAVITEKSLHIASFYLWHHSTLIPEVRQRIIELRSTCVRTRVLNEQFKKVIEDKKKTGPANLN